MLRVEDVHRHLLGDGDAGDVGVGRRGGERRGAFTAGDRHRLTVVVAVPRAQEVHGLGDVLDPGRVVGQLRQRGHRYSEARLQAHVHGHGVNRLAVGNERDARLRRAGRCGHRPRDGRHLGVHQRRLGDAGVSGHRLKLYRLLDADLALGLGLDDAAHGSRRPAQGSHAKVAKLALDFGKRVRDLAALDGDGPGLLQLVLPGEGQGRRGAVQGEGVVDALPLIQAGRPPEPQGTALRAAEGTHPKVQGGGGPQGHGGPVAGY